MKAILVIIGCVSLALGFIGIFVPLLPTTPFLLLSAALFAKSSEKLHFWLINHRVFGKYILDFQQHKTIPLKVKIVSISLIWVATLLNVLIWVAHLLWLQLLLVVISICVSVHILSFKTRKN